MPENNTEVKTFSCHACGETVAVPVYGQNIEFHYEGDYFATVEVKCVCGKIYPTKIKGKFVKKL